VGACTHIHTAILAGEVSEAQTGGGTHGDTHSYTCWGCKRLVGAHAEIHTAILAGEVSEAETGGGMHRDTCSYTCWGGK